MSTSIANAPLTAPRRVWQLVYQWSAAANPPPRRVIRGPARAASAPLGLGPPPGLQTGPLDAPFDFCGHIRSLCRDIVVRSPDLRHIDVDRLLFAVTQARSRRAQGLQARVTPLRFHAGRPIRRRRGVDYQVQRHFVDGREILYLVTFCLPRFLDQDFDDKFVTIFHELYHISPAFDGDLRRHAGRCTVHSQSKRAYDRHMAGLARAYLASGPDVDLHAFLRLNFTQLQTRHGRIIGIVVPQPKVVPVDTPCPSVAQA
jgi:predicted metallopeptidase